MRSGSCFAFGTADGPSKTAWDSPVKRNKSWASLVSSRRSFGGATTVFRAGAAAPPLPSPTTGVVSTDDRFADRGVGAVVTLGRTSLIPAASSPGCGTASRRAGCTASIWAGIKGSGIATDGASPGTQVRAIASVSTGSHTCRAIASCGGFTAGLAAATVSISFSRSSHALGAVWAPIRCPLVRRVPSFRTARSPVASGFYGGRSTHGPT